MTLFVLVSSFRRPPWMPHVHDKRHRFPVLETILLPSGHIFRLLRFAWTPSVAFTFIAPFPFLCRDTSAYLQIWVAWRRTGPYIQVLLSWVRRVERCNGFDKRILVFWIVFFFFDIFV